MGPGPQQDAALKRLQSRSAEIWWAAQCLFLLACCLPLFSILTGHVTISTKPGLARDISILLPTLGWLAPVLGILAYLRLRHARPFAARLSLLEQAILMGIIGVCVFTVTLVKEFPLLALIPVVLVALNYGTKPGILAAIPLCIASAVRMYLSRDLSDLDLFLASVIVLFASAYLIGGLKQINVSLIKELDAQRVALKNLIDALPLGIYVADGTGTVVYHNSRVGEGEARLCALLTEQRSVYTHRQEHLTGTDIEFENQPYRVRSTDYLFEGKACQVFIIENLSETRRLEEEIRRASFLASVGEMAAGVAHEIRNPLTVIKGYVQMLLEEKEDSKLGNVKAHLQIVVDEINRLGKIVQDFLSLAKPQDLDKVRLDFNELLVSVRDFLESEAVRQDAHLEIELDPSVGKIEGDPASLKQVVFNLVTNAFQAVGQGGRVAIRTYQRNRWAFLEVSDNGPGIPEDLREKVFVPFFSTKPAGTGIGLAISRRIVLDHGGNLSFRSEPGNTRFIVQIPLAHTPS